GNGSSATVYRAVLSTPSVAIETENLGSPAIERPVAVKLLNPVASDDGDGVLERLAEMARRVACIDHPNVIRVYEYGVWRSRPLLVTDLIEGVALTALQEAYAAKQRRLPLDVALFIAAEVAEALSGARTCRDGEGVQLGIVHGSISAREVLL